MIARVLRHPLRRRTCNAELSSVSHKATANRKLSQLSLSQKSELAMGMSLGVPSKRHQLGRC